MPQSDACGYRPPGGLPVVDAVAGISARLEAGEVVEGATFAGATPFDDAFGVACLGIVWDSFAWSRVTAHLQAGERHHQPFGMVHGGVWCAVVETLASVAGWLRVASHGMGVVGVNNSTDFLRPHRYGRVDAVAEPVHVGRTQQLWVVDLSRSTDAAVIARGQVRLHNLPVGT